MNWFEALILGLFQGLTEFLPVSSSGHLEIAKSLFGIDSEESFFFTLAVHGATVLSTLFVFWDEILNLARQTFRFKRNEESAYIMKILLSMVPVGIAGIILKDPIESLFSGNIVFVGAMLLITASILAIAHFVKKRERKITYLDALIIGLAQAIAVIPGISRSGSTIATGLIIGNSKSEVARFSFLMVLIPVLGANFLEILSWEGGAVTIEILPIVIGSITAFIAGYAACTWMIALVKRSRLIWFSIYCFIVGLISILLG
jgi:undecaprenyl-diphosphatase